MSPWNTKVDVTPTPTVNMNLAPKQRVVKLTLLYKVNGEKTPRENRKDLGNLIFNRLKLLEESFQENRLKENVDNLAQREKKEPEEAF